MTIEELRDTLDAPLPDAEDFELAPGIVLKIRGILSFSDLQDAHQQAEALKMLGKPVAVGGVPIPLSDQNTQFAVLVACGVVEPRLTVRDALQMSGRYGLRYYQLANRIGELSDSGIEQQAKKTEAELAANPSTPAA